MKLPQCAREGCQRTITLVAWRHQDPFCSTACCRAHLKLPGWETAISSQRLSDRIAGTRKSQASTYGDAGRKP